MTTESKKLLFSVTASDCDWKYSRGSGAGGQKKNKTSSAVHCIHKASGAVGYAQDTRSQAKNRELAFERMAKTKTFQTWHELECMRVSGLLEQIEVSVQKEIQNVKIEIKEDSKWKTIPKDSPLS